MGWVDMKLQTFLCYLSFGVGAREGFSLLKQSFLILVALMASTYAEKALFNLMTFFTEYGSVRPIEAAAYTNAIDGMTGIVGIVGAILVDVFLTHYGELFISSTFYFLGLGLLTSVTPPMWFKAVLSTCHKSDKCVNMRVHVLYFLAFSLLVVGRSSLNTSVQALWKGKRGDNTLKKYTINGITLLLDVITTETIIFIPTWRLLFGIGSLLMIPTIVLVLYYNRDDFVKGRTESRKSPLMHVLRVFVAFMLKCRICSVQDHNMLYEKQNPSGHILPHTNWYRFLDKAAMIESSSGNPMEIKEERKKWRLCKVTEVEEVKRLLRMVPMCMTFIAYGMVKSVGNTFFLDQGNNM